MKLLTGKLNCKACGKPMVKGICSNKDCLEYWI